MSEERIVKSLKIKPSVKKAAKIYAIENNMTFSKVVEAALEEYLRVLGTHKLFTQVKKN